MYAIRSYYVIVALGGTAAEALLGVRKSLGELRGAVHALGGIPLIVTYHPAVITSYSIHYTKLYECRRKFPTASRATRCRATRSM